MSMRICSLWFWHGLIKSAFLGYKQGAHDQGRFFAQVTRMRAVGMALGLELVVCKSGVTLWGRLGCPFIFLY